MPDAGRSTVAARCSFDWGISSSEKPHCPLFKKKSLRSGRGAAGAFLQGPASLSGHKNLERAATAVKDCRPTIRASLRPSCVA
jgi:hypothetical protein